MRHYGGSLDHIFPIHGLPSPYLCIQLYPLPSVGNISDSAPPLERKMGQEGSFFLFIQRLHHKYPTPPDSWRRPDWHKLVHSIILKLCVHIVEQFVLVCSSHSTLSEGRSVRVGKKKKMSSQNCPAAQRGNRRHPIF